MIAREATEHSWTVNGLTLSGLAWGDPGQAPLLMLHGWLDNAASFNMLAPLLVDFYVVALDLTGHGQSDRRSADANYQIWDDLPEILGIVEQLSWAEFDLVGHSRGAIISALLASALPQRIKHLVLLDAISPPAILQQDFPDQLRKFLEQKPALLIAQNRVFATIAEAALLRENGELSPEAALTLVERSLRPCTGGFTWTMDRRLYGASAVKLTAAQNEAVLAGLTMPTLLLLAEGGRMASASEMIETLKHNATLVVEYRSGGHHFHMEEPVSPLAKRIDNFLKRGG